ncbi:MFS transporter [Campylobacter jejuni]|uniref:MFS transporter n=1 Tax=Campylobacter jejuni TaxID=197 RepID=UPI0002588D8C|nr:MFS transporter [Campylobacter jejuni]AHW92620.1 Major facilitator family transporter, putative [Campylobacter jejuni subsp. jejuni R14]AYA31544.1 MFS transporter [Campylobacter jejuni subsp. jejuni]EAH7598865.1 MFS transporter [Campylobacter jejuni]EAH8350358.1 MFS transporter [Campylobacter jejuni]EAI2874889.1 MFS transporter [Campylobacter jejuni]
MKNLNKASNTQIILVFCLGVFGILSTELGMMGIIPIVSQNFSVSISDAGWCASIFALVITFCAPIVPLLCANFNPKKLMLICLAVFILSSLTSAFVGEFWQLLILRAIPAFFHPIYIALALSMVTNLVEDKKEIPKTTAKIFAAVSAGMVLGVPMTSYFGGNFSFKMAMLFFVFLNTLSFIATLFFVPDFKKVNSVKISKQLLILRYSLLWIRVLCVICINAGIWGFYSYFSDFLHSVGKMNFTLISIVLAIYGFSNIIGNYIAGKTLVKNANFTLILTPLIMIGFYILLFSFYSEIILIIFAFILGILAGVMNNGTHFMISYPFPKAANFSNGLFISVANIGLSTGTAICGLVISLSDTRYIIVNTIVLLILGIIMIFVRSRIEKMKLRF